jgi:DHA2 family multidrug resistance protein-like MFS transporter
MRRLFEDLPGDDGMRDRERRLVMLAVIIATVMAVLDSSIVTVALPTMALELHGAPSMTVWVANAYTLAAAMTLVTFAALAQTVGFRWIHVGGLGVFTLASLGCTLARSMDMLIGMRFLQGLGGAALMSVGPALYRTAFPTRLLGSALGINALVVAAVTAAGPAIGGAMLTALGWPWLFAVNLPLGLFAVALSWRTVPGRRRPGQFDWPGAVLSAVAMGAFILAVDALSRPHEASPSVIALLVAVLSALAFVARPRRAPAPLLPFDVFGIASFSMAAGTSMCSFVGQGIAFIALPFLFQQAYGFDALMSAALFTPWPIAIVIAAPLAGRLADRYSPPVLSTCGLGAYAVGLALLAMLRNHPSIPDVLWRAFVCGAGFGFFQSPNNRELLGSVPRARSGTAAGVLAIVRTFGHALGAAFVAIALATLAALHPREGQDLVALHGARVSLWIATLAACATTVVSALRIRPR